MEAIGINSCFGALIRSWVYSFHMPLFFMLSGYVHGMRQRQAGTTDFLHGLRQNFIALYVPCMFFSFLQAFLNLIVFSRSNAANVHIPELRHFMMIPFNGFLNYWFLCALFLVKSIHMAFESAGANEHLHSFFWVSLFVLSWIAGDSMPRFLFLLCYNSLCFRIGYILSRREYITETRNPGAFWGLVLLGSGIAFLLVYYSGGVAGFFTKAGSALCMVLSLMVLFFALSIKSSFLSVCGLYSMVIYCIHNYAAMTFRIMYRISGVKAGSFPAFSYIMCFIAALFIPLAIVWLYKNVKCLRWVECIFYPSRLLRVNHVQPDHADDRTDNLPQ